MATPSARPIASSPELLLLVEGRNDSNAVFQLVRLRFGADPSFAISDCGGADGVLRKLSALLADSDPQQRILGLILDTDIEGSTEIDAVQRRWAQLRSKIGSGYSLPDEFPQDGLVMEPLPGRKAKGKLPRIGVWLMPNNKAFGMFEDLLMESLGAREKDYTSGVVTTAKTDGVASFHDSHHSKAVIRTYMAWQEPPDVQYIGLAIKEGHFQNIEIACEEFLTWLGHLYGPLTHQMPETDASKITGTSSN